MKETVKNYNNRGTFSLNEDILNNDLSDKPHKQQTCSLFNNCFILQFGTNMPWNFNTVQMSIVWARPVSLCCLMAETASESLEVTQTCRKSMFLMILLSI